jgi:hypothetical protein
MAVFCFLISPFPMHLDFTNTLSLVSTVTWIGAFVFTGLQVRAANRARREQAAVTVIETSALSENSARFLELLSEIPEGASAAAIENLDAEPRRQIFLFGLRVGSNRLHGFSRFG